MASQSQLHALTAQLNVVFSNFVFWSGHVHPGGSPLPASEWTLILFITELSRSLKASSIKVYLSGIRSLHVENGFDNPLKNRPRLEQVLRGIKLSQGLDIRPRRPITVSLLRSLHSYIQYNTTCHPPFCLGRKSLTMRLLRTR